MQDEPKCPVCGEYLDYDEINIGVRVVRRANYRCPDPECEGPPCPCHCHGEGPAECGCSYCLDGTIPCMSECCDNKNPGGPEDEYSAQLRP